MAALIVNAASGKSRSKSEKIMSEFWREKIAKFMAQFTAILCSKKLHANANNHVYFVVIASCLSASVVTVQ